MKLAIACLLFIAVTPRALAAQRDPQDVMIEEWLRKEAQRQRESWPGLEVTRPDAPDGVELVVRSHRSGDAAGARPALWIVGGRANEWTEVDRQMERWGAQHGLTFLTCGWEGEGERSGDVAPPGPAETAAALRAVVANPAALGIDPDRIAAVATGADRSAELLRWLGADARAALRAVVLLDPVDVVAGTPPREVALVARPPAMITWRAPGPAERVLGRAANARALQQLSALAGTWAAAGSPVELHVLPLAGTLSGQGAHPDGTTGRWAELMADFLTLQGVLTTVPPVAAADRENLSLWRSRGADGSPSWYDTCRATGWVLAVDGDANCELVIDWAASPIARGHSLAAVENGRYLGEIEILSTNGVRARGRVKRLTEGARIRPGVLVSGEVD